MFEHIKYVDLKYKPKSSDVIAEFYVEPHKNISLEMASNFIAGESSIGTWTDVKTMKPRIKRKLKPHVFYINKKNNIIKIAYPIDLFEIKNIPGFLSGIAGNIFGMKSVENLRLIDIDFPKEFIEYYKGPEFGVEGIRKMLKVYDRPLLGSIVKPKMGLNPKEHAEVAYNVWVGGLDLVKDDENLVNQDFNRFEERLRETLKKRELAEKLTGERKEYMPNITGTIKDMKQRAKLVKEYGGNYIMIDLITIGWSAFQYIRELAHDLKLAIHAHRAMHAAFTRNPKHGVSMLVIAKLARLIGADQIHVGTANIGKMESNDQEIFDIQASIEEDESIIGRYGKTMIQKWGHIKPIFPVLSGGLHPGSIEALLNLMGEEVIMQFGGGCHGHPNGTQAGARAIRYAVNAYMNGISLEEAKKYNKDLKLAINKFGLVKQR